MAGKRASPSFNLAALLERTGVAPGADPHATQHGWKGPRFVRGVSVLEKLLRCLTKFPHLVLQAATSLLTFLKQAWTRNIGISQD